MSNEALNSLVSEQEKVGIGIPAKYKSHNSFQLGITWIESESLISDEKQKRQELVNRLNGFEQIKVEKTTEGIKGSIITEDFKKYKDVIDEAFFAFVKNLGNTRIPGMTDLEYFYLNHLLVRETGVQHFKEENEYFQKENELMKKLWGLLYYRFAYDFLRKVSEAKIKADDTRGINQVKSGIGLKPEQEQVTEIKPQSKQIGIPELRTKAEYQSLFTGSINTLKQKNGNSGLIEMPEGIPTFVISDIHARPDFVWNFLNSRIGSMGNKTIIQLLEEGKVNVVCVGDYFHSERLEARSLMRYKIKEIGGVEFTSDGKPPLTEYGKILSAVANERGVSIDKALAIINKDSKYKNEATKIKQLEEELLETEMKKNFYTLELLLKISNKFPNFFMCRGNHDFTKNPNVKKFSDEGIQMKGFIEQRYGKDFLDLWDSLEEQFGLMAIQRQSGAIISHTFGSQEITEEGVKTRDDKVSKNLTWTDNRNISDEKLEKRFKATCRNLGMDSNNTTWVIGHRPIEEGTNYRSQIGGHIIQINDDKRNLVALINGGKLVKVFDL